MVAGGGEAEIGFEISAPISLLRRIATSAVELQIRFVGFEFEPGPLLGTCKTPLGSSTGEFVVYSSTGEDMRRH
jgi:hypothetical protein